MPKTRPPYPAQFRTQILELARAGRSIAELSKEFGLSTQTIRNWLRQTGADEDRPGARAASLTTDEREELAQLRRENKKLKQERDILAKATTWFATRGE